MTIEKKSVAPRTVGERESARPARVPLGIPKRKLGVAYLIDGYHLHWINDENDRIFQAQQGGYEFVAPDEVGVITPEKESNVKRNVGKKDDGTPLAAFLMKIKQEWYDEDQASLEKINNQFDDAIRGGKLENVNNSYVPREGIRMSNKRK